MSQLGSALTDESLAPPVGALFVYNSNPAAVAPDQERVLEGLAREDLLVVVHEQFQTDTADFADILLPATTALEHFDIHKSYGHLYVSLSEPAIAPLGEAVSNTELFRRLADHDGARGRVPLQTLIGSWRARPSTGKTRGFAASISERLERDGYARLNVSAPQLPFAEGGFPTPSGRCEFLAESRAEAGGIDPLAGYVPPRESVVSAPKLAERYPLAFISPPAHHFLNSTFSAQPTLMRREGEPVLTIHPSDAEARSLQSGQMLRIFNDRGSFCAPAHVSTDARPGVVVGLSIWWHKHCPGRRNGNAVTSQELADLGGGASFYDVLVEVERLSG